LSRPRGSAGRGAAVTFAEIARQTGVSTTTAYRDYRSALAKMGVSLDEVPRRMQLKDSAKKLALA